MASLKDFTDFLKSLISKRASETLKIVEDKQDDLNSDSSGKTFELTKEETDKLNKWFQEHKTYTGTIGVGPTVKFTPTSIGTIVEAEFNGESIILRELS